MIPDQDKLIAAVEMIGRAGALNFEIAYDDTHDDPVTGVPIWNATARWQGARIFVEHHLDPAAAADALARKILNEGGCVHCQRRIKVGGIPRPDRCTYRRIGERWERGCH